jgi:hypothetical protein
VDVSGGGEGRRRQRALRGGEVVGVGGLHRGRREGDCHR